MERGGEGEIDLTLLATRGPKEEEDHCQIPTIGRPKKEEDQS
jgi:hypothetical protein